MSADLSNHEAPRESADITALRIQLEVNQSKLRVAKIAFHNRSEIDGKIPEYEDLSAIAKDLIATTYELQTLLYGEVKMKMSVAKLLRATSR